MATMCCPGAATRPARRALEMMHNFLLDKELLPYLTGVHALCITICILRCVRGIVSPKGRSNS